MEAEGRRGEKGQGRKEEAQRQINGWEWEGGEEAGAQGGRGTDSAVGGKLTMLPPHPKCLSQESRKHWFAGLQ